MLLSTAPLIIVVLVVQQLCTLCYALDEQFESAGYIGNGTRHLKRGKRYLDFLATSRMFFRINTKVNIIPKPQIWANAYGFRVNIPIEFDKRYRPYKRDTYAVVHELLDKQGFDGEACVLKAFCMAHVVPSGDAGTEGFLFKLLKYIFTLTDDERRYFSYLREENCAQLLHSHCPLSFNSISPFTDDI